MIGKAQNTIVILHFNPLERYPPIINLLNYLGENSKNKVVVITTCERRGSELNNYQNSAENIEIKRTPHVIPMSRLRIFSYLHFYLYALFIMIWRSPKSVLYFETISSWPALIYKKIKGKTVKLLVHYHEYTSPAEYKNNMWLVKKMHESERKMYTTFSWISHTNELRIKEFRKDCQLQNMDNGIFHAMPNYPSKNWAKENKGYSGNSKIKMVYAGALGFDTMYLKEITDWVIDNSEFLSLDIYAYNIDDKADEFLKVISNDAVSFKGSCNYEDLPGILVNYDVGLVIYKLYSDNFMQGISNKVYEYLACGLDVWFSKEIEYTSTIARSDVFPKIIAVDFANLEEFNFQKAFSRVGIPHKETDFFSENVYSEILACLQD